MPCIEYVETLENPELLMLSYQNLQKMYDIPPKWDNYVRYLAKYSYNEQARMYIFINCSQCSRKLRRTYKKSF